MQADRALLTVLTTGVADALTIVWDAFRGCPG